MADALTNEELVSLIQDGQNETANIEALYLQNKGLIASVASCFKGQEDIDDLMQEGFFGLMTAVKLWDPEAGASFATYAHYWIHQAMRRYLDNTGGAVRLPVAKRRELYQYQKVVNDTQMMEGREPSLKELQIKTGFTPEKVESLKREAAFLSIRSLNELLTSNDDATLEDMIPDPENDIDDLLEDMNRSERDALLWQMVKELPDDQGEIIELKYKEQLTCKQSAARLGRKESQIQSSEAKAMRTLRSSKCTKRLLPYLDDRSLSAAYRGGGVMAFRRTHESATERAAFLELEHRLMQFTE